MNDSLHDPPRWKDRNDQRNPAERSAGHAFRCAAREPRRAAPPLSRVTARIRGSRSPKRLVWALATTAFILGVAAAASAAHYDLLPAWLLNIVRPRPEAPAREGARRAKAATPTAPSSRAAAVPNAPPAPPATPPAPVPQVAARVAVERTATAPGLAPVSTRRASSPPRELAMVELDERLSAAPPPGNAALPTVPLPQVTSTPPEAMGKPSIPEVIPSPSPTPTTAPAVVPSSPPSVAGVAPNPVPASTSTATAPSPQGAGKYLAETIHWLRKEHAPASALRLLDRHEAELIKAGFGHETLILRVEALVALGRRSEVLRLLDAASLTHVAASRALLVTRGELRAAANRCAEGLGDFELVLARSQQVDRQALTGRALCRKRLGDLAGAGADIQRLREEFPNERLPGELEK
jgi:hypothetical protein